MARPSHLARLAAALSPLLLPATAAAAPTWSALPDGPASGVAQQRAAGDGAGQTIAWQQAAGSGTELWTARRASGASALGTAVRVSPPAGTATVSDVVLSADTEGRAALAWTGRTTANANGVVQVATRASRTAAWSAPVTVSDTAYSANTPSVAVDASGAALVAWRQVTSGYAEARIASVSTNGAATAVQTVAAANANVSLPRVAVDPVGNAALAWVETGISYSPPYIGAVSLKAMSRAAGASTFSKSVTVFNASSQSIVDPQLQMDEAGNGTMAWQMMDVDSGAAQGVWAASRPLGSSGWAAEWPSGPHACAPAIGTSQSGGAVVAWVEPTDGTCAKAAGAIGVARRTPGTSAWELNHGLSAASIIAGPPSASVGPDGTAVVAWPAGATATADRVQAAVFAPAANDFWPAGDVAAPSGIASAPTVAVEPGGSTLALWARRASAGGAAAQAMSALAATSVSPGAPGTTSATPTPTPTPTPAATPTPTPAVTPTPAPGATPTPAPGASPAPTTAPTPSTTPVATPTPTPAPSTPPAPAPAVAPAATATPAPVAASTKPVPASTSPTPAPTAASGVSSTSSTSSVAKATAIASGATDDEEAEAAPALGLVGVRALAKKRWRPARCGAALATRGRGMPLQFRTDAAGTLRIVVTSTPRRGRARNLKPALALEVAAGTTRTVFTGCLAKRRLAAGRYKLKIVFVGEDGNAGGRRALNFAISR